MHLHFLFWLVQLYFPTLCKHPLYLVLLAVAFRGVIVGLFRAILIAAYAEVNDTHVPPTDLAASDDRHNLFPTIGERRERARAAFTPH